MKCVLFSILFCAAAVLPARAQDPVTLGYLDEKIQKLRAEVEDLQFRLKKTEDTLAAIRTEIKELRVAGSSASPEQLQALEAKIAAVDAARQRDRQAIIDELAKQLASLGGAPAKPVAGSNREHIVQRGETLSAIARQHGVTLTDLRKANNLTLESVITPGQKLVLPAK